MPQDLTCNSRQKSECCKLSPAQGNCMVRTTETDCIRVFVCSRETVIKKERKYERYYKATRKNIFILIV
jgi:hypothetical protein